MKPESHSFCQALGFISGWFARILACTVCEQILWKKITCVHLIHFRIIAKYIWLLHKNDVWFTDVHLSLENYFHCNKQTELWCQIDSHAHTRSIMKVCNYCVFSSTFVILQIVSIITSGTKPSNIKWSTATRYQMYNKRL